MPDEEAVRQPVDRLAGEDVAPEDRLRAGLYRVLARYLSSPPDAAALSAGASLEGDDTPLGRAVATFAHLAARTAPEAAADEYHELFIGIGRGELLPYASYYLTGFLNEKPLARLRQDMARLGVARNPDNKDPEDHIAAICETMAGLIEGEFGSPLGLEEQRRFFADHLNAWAPHFFKDLEAANASVLYGALGTIGRLFLEIEAAAFEMVPASRPGGKAEHERENV